MKKIVLLLITCCCSFPTFAQYHISLSPKVSVGINTNVETYFFAEKLAVERIGQYVFDVKGVDYSHQPIVYFGYKTFSKFQNEQPVIRIAELLQQIRDTVHDNGPILEYLLNQREFPAQGARYQMPEGKSGKETASAHLKLRPLFAELTDSLSSFYRKAQVGAFLKANAAFYRGALQEIAKDIHAAGLQGMEKWYGQQFPAYELYISPGMPITPGEDAYRGFGPGIWSPQGVVPAMVVSSSKMLKPEESLAAYRQFGFDNQKVTNFISSHEIGHSFVNPQLDGYMERIKADSMLYTPALKALLEPNHIRDWPVTVIEHLVRLCEVRVAVADKNEQQAAELRKIHIGEYGCVLLPILEIKVTEYERNRSKYPDFKSYLPELIRYLHELKPEIIDQQVLKYKAYNTKIK